MTVIAGKYIAEERIGVGGMATVYRGRLLGVHGFERPVAIKRIHPGHASDPSFVAMFKREARIAARLNHPNIVSIVDFDRAEDGGLFLVMEFIEGVDLRRLVKAGPVPVACALFVVAKVLGALAHAHSVGVEGAVDRVVHRDVTPHNILISREGDVKLSDFGIARAMSESPLTKTGVVKGKMGYLSPEQARGEPLDARSDLFSLGVILHELVAGDRLFRVASGAAGLLEVQRKLADGIPSLGSASVDVSAELIEVSDRLLAIDRSARFRSGEEALDALLSCPEVSNRGREDLAEHLCEMFDGTVALALDPAAQTETEDAEADASVLGLTEPTTRVMASAVSGDRRVEHVAPPPRARWFSKIGWILSVGGATLGLVLLADRLRTEEAAVVPTAHEEREPPARVQPIVEPRATTKSDQDVRKVAQPRTSVRPSGVRRFGDARRTRQSVVDAPTTTSPKPPTAEPTQVSPDVLEARIDAVGRRLRAGLDVDRSRAAILDQQYFDLRAAARGARRTGDWSQVELRLRRVEREVATKARAAGSSDASP
ncbi:MAG: serine/threonine-protein kinase [Deltaproteobacteria bacterium]|jgi:hypothetical protein